MKTSTNQCAPALLSEKLGQSLDNQHLVNRLISQIQAYYIATYFMGKVIKQNST
mgnify:CR=1 FL=1